MRPGLIDRLAEELSRLPGIGRKTAQRLAFHILAMPAHEAKSISRAIDAVKDNARFCRQCFNITDEELCAYCLDPKRDPSRICVVEEPSDVMVMERTAAYKGLYHVLHGALAPMDNVEPGDLRIGELLARVRAGGIAEVIIATNPNTKGEMTARYIAEELRGSGVSVTRLAYGLPMGGDLEFADEVTLRKSLEGRRALP